MLGRRAGVMAQTVQRVIDPRRGKQRERLRLARARLESAVGNAIVHGSQVGQVKHVAHQLAPLGAHAALDVVMFGKREMHRDRLRAGANFQLDLVVGQQQGELLQVIGAKQIGAGQRGLEAARAGHKAETQARALGAVLAQHGVRLHPYKRVAGPHMAG